MSARRNGRGPGRRDVTIYGISDPEVLGIVDDLADENGWATTYGVRLQLGEDVDSHERTGVGIRLAWLKRYGWLESGEREKVDSNDPRGWRWSQSWRLTAVGHALLDDPELNKTVENALAKLNPAQRLRVTREMAASAHAGAPEIRTALRRQWLRSLGR
jgi:hypothetical protein